jgi:hypothetical protein
MLLTIHIDQSNYLLNVKYCYKGKIRLGWPDENVEPKNKRKLYLQFFGVFEG